MGNSFGEKLKRLREENGLSQEDLAQKLNVSRQAVYKWEKNKGYPDIENLIRISDTFNVTIDDLIRSDRKLQENIRIGDGNNFEQLSKPGFYLGMMIVFLGVLVFEGSVSDTLMIFGILIMVFFDDFIKSIRSLF